MRVWLLRWCGAGRERLGALAQLGERLNGIQEVSGSIPLCSTAQKLPHTGNQTTERG